MRASHALTLAGGLLVLWTARAGAQASPQGSTPVQPASHTDSTARDSAAVAAEEAEAMPIKLKGFYDRRASKRGFYLERKDIDANVGKRLSDMIRDLPGVRLLPSQSSAVMAVRFRGCMPLVWVDGVRNMYDELDAVASPGDVGAMEVYVSPATVPAQFRDMRQSCGAVLVWTR